MRATTWTFRIGLIIAAGLAVGCGSAPKEARFIEVGKRYLARKDPARAVIEFKNAVQAAPGSAEAEYQLGLAYLAAGDTQSGVGHLMRATELNPKHAAAQLKIAQLMSTSHKKEVLEEAARRAKEAFALTPDDPGALDTLAMTEWSLADPKAAEEHLQQALKKFPAHLQSAVMLANLKLAQKDFAAAEGILKGLVDQAPEGLQARLALAEFYTLTKKSAEAEGQFQQALKIDSKNPQAMMGLAAIWVRGGRKPEAEALYQRLSILPDKEYRPAHALFQLYFGDPEKGVSELETLHRRDASDRNIRNRLVTAYLTRRGIPAVEKLLTAELKKNSKDIDALLQRGQIFLALGRYTEAEQDLNNCLRFQPDLATARFHLAMVYGARGETLRQQQELGEAIRRDPAMLRARIALAKQLLEGSAAQAALDLMNQAPAYQSELVEVITQRNLALIALGNIAEAQKGVEQGLRLSRTPDLMLQDAALKMRLKDMVRGQAELEEVLKRDPGNVKAVDLLMASYVAQKKVGLGLERIRAQAAAAPKSLDLQLSVGNWMRMNGKPGEARAAYEAAKVADPKSTVPTRFLAELDLREGKYDLARKRLNELPAAERSAPEMRTLSAMVEQQSGNYSAAIEQFRQVLAASPKSVVALNNLAYLLVDYANLPDEGLKYAQKVKELAPNDPVVDDTIGWAYYQKGLYSSAVAHLEKAAARSRASAIMQYHLSMAYLKAGDARKGRQILDAALRLDPKLPEAKTARQLIDASKP